MIKQFITNLYVCDSCGDCKSYMKEFEEDDFPECIRPDGWGSIGAGETDQDLCPLCLTNVRWTLDKKETSGAA